MQRPMSTLAEMMNPTDWSTKLYSRMALKVIPIFCTFRHSGHDVTCEDGQMNRAIDEMIIRTESTNG